MGEIIADDFCERYQKYTEHIFSASGEKGSCKKCGNSLPPKKKPDYHKIIYFED